MKTLDKIAEVLSHFDLDGASGHYDATLQEAAYAVVKALRDVPFKIYEKPAKTAFQAAEYDEDLRLWNSVIDSVLNEKS